MKHFLRKRFNYEICELRRRLIGSRNTLVSYSPKLSYAEFTLDKMAPLLGLKNVGYMRAFTTKQENQQKERNEKKSICRNGCPQRNDPNRVFHEQFKGNIERTTDKTQ
ncbi:hypothetical protein FFZ96_11385 [Leptospira borgpetersenii]|nr:hypothetical protein FFZ96_11385 [Leptospira borgpetersenii]